MKPPARFSLHLVHADGELSGAVPRERFSR